MPPFPEMRPPLINSACLWSSTPADIEAIYTSAYTGGVTTRTACHPTNGFTEDKSIHQHAFASSSRGVLPLPPVSDDGSQTTHPMPGPRRDLSDVSSLNSYGYAPLNLARYVGIVKDLERKHPAIRKPIIFSVTGTSRTVADSWILLIKHHDPRRDWCMEINLSCPNIPGKPPPAYSNQQLRRFLSELREHISRYVFMYVNELNGDAGEDNGPGQENFLPLKLPIGLKLPPYTYAGQFDDITEVVRNFNSAGFSALDADMKADSTSLDPGGTVPNMIEQAIDPTLLSNTDVDAFASELSFDMENKLSLEEALNERGNEIETSKPKPWVESLNEFSKTTLGKFVEEEVFAAPWPIAFVTATNTLGSSLLLEDTEEGWLPALRGVNGTVTGLGGLAGAALHPLALGNVANLRKRIGQTTQGYENVKIIGVGGVSDRDGFQRMLAAGADIVGLATALGARGAAIFEDILKDDD